MQANVKTREGADHPDRDAQFQYINDTAAAALQAGEPVISVDTKKRDWVGEFKAVGREWARSGEPVLVNTHDFPSHAKGKAIPYGVYDLKRNEEWVSVGTVPSYCASYSPVLGQASVSGTESQGRRVAHRVIAFSERARPDLAGTRSMLASEFAQSRAPGRGGLHSRFRRLAASCRAIRVGDIGIVWFRLLTGSGALPYRPRAPARSRAEACGLAAADRRPEVDR